MDPLSITTGCLTLVSSITKLSLQIHAFVREVRDARGDLDAVSRELQSLKTILEILAEDAKDINKGSFPESLQKQISGIVTNCGNVVVQIETCLESHAGTRLGTRVKWSLAGRGDVEKLRSTLEAHKSALDIALEMLTLTLTREIKADTTELRNDTTAIKEDTEQILREIARLQSRLPKDQNRQNSSFILQRYLEDATTYAESSYAASMIDYGEPSHPVGIPESEEVRIQESAEETDDRLEYSEDSGEVSAEVQRLGPTTEEAASSPEYPTTEASARWSTATMTHLHKDYFENAERRAHDQRNDKKANLADALAPNATGYGEDLRHHSEVEALSFPKTNRSKKSTGSSPSSHHPLTPAAAKLTPDASGRWGALNVPKVCRTLEGHSGCVSAVAFSPDGKMLASASRDKTVRLWDLATGAERRTLKSYSSWVQAVAFSPNGKMLAFASDDKTVRLWDFFLIIG